MAKTETIRGLRRGLQALQMNPILSLHAIHLATDISKPGLLRILHTLEQFGMVSRRLADGHYRISTVTSTARPWSAQAQAAGGVKQDGIGGVGGYGHGRHRCKNCEAAERGAQR